MPGVFVDVPTPAGLSEAVPCVSIAWRPGSAGSSLAVTRVWIDARARAGLGW